MAEKEKTARSHVSNYNCPSSGRKKTTSAQLNWTVGQNVDETNLKTL